ncbi:hypothetical protein MH111_18670 [Bacillus altitudinis]|uniref:hypothetical protein n=1 Tax=Bacillus altitudinis TaxID=293387 RepID=UPI002282206D|nr:hypothetical protein [Bacillus altitudinis]MCY7692453.1 hypothetical protein [Bacillus altitudinis]
MKISNLMVREFVLSIIEEEASIITAEDLADHLLLREDDIILFSDEEFINFDRSELLAIKHNILHTKMLGHDLNEIEKGILEKIELAFQQIEE